MDNLLQSIGWDQGLYLFHIFLLLLPLLSLTIVLYHPIPQPFLWEYNNSEHLQILFLLLQNFCLLHIHHQYQYHRMYELIHLSDLTNLFFFLQKKKMIHLM